MWEKHAITTCCLICAKNYIFSRNIPEGGRADPFQSLLSPECLARTWIRPDQHLDYEELNIQPLLLEPRHAAGIAPPSSAAEATN